MNFSLFCSPCPDLLPPNVRNTKLTVRIAPRKPPSHSWQNFGNPRQAKTASYFSDPSLLLLLKDTGILHSSSVSPGGNYRRHSSPQPARSQCTGVEQGMSARERSVFQFPDLCHHGKSCVAVAGLASSALWLRLSQIS